MNEIDKPVNELKINEFLRTCLNKFILFLPSEYPTMPSDEKA